MIGHDAELIEALGRARRKVGRYLDRCAAELLALEPRVVGFSTVLSPRV